LGKADIRYSLAEIPVFMPVWSSTKLTISSSDLRLMSGVITRSAQPGNQKQEWPVAYWLIQNFAQAVPMVTIGYIVTIGTNSIMQG